MKKAFYLFLCFLIYLIFGVCVAAYTGKIGSVIYVWNVFLAFLPFLFVQILLIYRKKDARKKAVVILLALLWLIFFPNAPYMITDFMYFAVAGEAASLVFWIRLVYIGSGILLAAVLGLDSLYDMHRLVIGWKGHAVGHLLLAAVCLLSGFGIYIGRILRFNSWDVLRPVYLLTSVMRRLDLFAVLFSLFFAAFIAGAYIVYCLIVRSRGEIGDTRFESCRKTETPTERT